MFRLMFMASFGFGLTSCFNGEVAGGFSLIIVSVIFPAIDSLTDKKPQ